MTEEHDAGPMHVLGVDDHEVNRQIIREMLGAAGVRVDEAADADTGLGRMDLKDYDLVLMDLQMPGKDGLTDTREIRARGDTKGKIPVLVVTGETGANIRRQVQDSGADGLLLKPLKMDQLVEAIVLALAAHSENRTVLI